MQERNSARPVKRLLAVALSVIMLIGVMAVPVSAASGARGSITLEKVDNDAVKAARNPLEFVPAEGATPTHSADEVVRVSIVLDKASTLEAGYSTKNIAANSSAMNYRDSLRQEQASVQSKIETQALGGNKLDVKWNLTLAANIISANVKYGDIEAIKAVDGVKKVILENRYEPQVVSVGGEVEPNMAVSGQMTGAASLWTSGVNGAGTKIAIIDTGVDIDHQSFDSKAFDYAISEDMDITGNTYDLLERNDIKNLMSQLNATTAMGANSMADLYRSSKVPFAFNYVDENNNVTHLKDTQGEHGSHVAGIAAANRYVDTNGDGELEVAADAIGVTGNAPDAQLLVMKVFGAGGGAYDSDYMVAIEDAIILGADAVNLSLGSGNAGFTTDSDYQDILDSFADSDTVVVMSAGNSGSWSENTAPHALYSDDVNFDTVGSPGSFANSLAVASVDNDGSISPTIEVAGHKIGISDTSANYGFPTLASLDENKTGKEFNFIYFTSDDTKYGANASGKSLIEDYAEDIEGKVVFLTRGESNFGYKLTAAASAGAAACVVVNNAPGAINMNLADGEGDIPCVGISQEDGAFVLANAEADEGGNYSTGTLIVNGNVTVTYNNSDYYTMSSYSSWGVPGDLSLKPEISAPGGSIYSVLGANTGSDAPTTAHNLYELMSGTSMASPQIAGLSASVQGYLEDNGMAHYNGVSSRALTQSLLMGAATPMKDADGHYYSLLQQGAGLANVVNAVSSPAYIMVDGQDDGKVKVELGDDPAKTGEYSFSFTLNNFSDVIHYYALSAEVFTQAVDGNVLLGSTRDMDADVTFTVNGEVVKADPSSLNYDFNGDGNLTTADAQLLLDSIMKGTKINNHTRSTDVDGDGDVDTHDVHVLLSKGLTYVTLPAEGSVKVDVTIKLTDAEKAQLARENPKGAYVEAYVKATGASTNEGVNLPELSIPVFGFYGNWTDPSMFDRGAPEEWYEGEYADGTTPYLATPLSGSVTNVLIANGAMVFNGGGVATTVDEYAYTLIRNAGNGVFRMTWKDADGTEHVRWSEDLGEEIGAFYYVNGGSWQNYQTEAPIGFELVDEDGNPLPDGTEVEISVIKAPEYYAKYDYDWDILTDGDLENGELGEGAFLTTKVVVDTKAPEIVDEKDKTYWADTEDDGRHIYVTAKDNVGLAFAELYDQDGETLVYAFERGYYDEETLYTTALTSGPDEELLIDFDGVYEPDLFYLLFAGVNVWTRAGDLDDDVYYIIVGDGAGNTSTYRMFVGIEPTSEVESVTISADTLKLFKGNSAQLSAIVEPMTLSDRGVDWSTSDAAVATVDENGLVTAVADGTATITATAKLKGAEGAAVTATCEVTVETLALEITGILGDEVGTTQYFDWDLNEGTLTYPHTVGDVVNPVAAAVDGENFYAFDSSYVMHHVNQATGKNIDTAAWAETKPTPWGMAYSKEGLHWSYAYYLMIQDDPMVPTYMGFNFSSALAGDYLTAVAYDGTPWTYDLQGESYHGNYRLFAVDTSGWIWEIMVFEEDGQISCLRGAVPSNLTVNAEQNDTDGPSVSLFYGEDGNLYYAEWSGDTSEFYMLVPTVEDGEIASWTATRIGDVGDGVWPAFIFSAENKGAAAADDAHSYNYDVENVEVLEAEALDPADMVASVKADAANNSVVGSLNSVEVSEDAKPGEVGTGVLVSDTNKTVTVPVYGTDFTNGRFTLNYDASVLDLVSVEPTADSLVSYVAKEGAIDIGAAVKNLTDGKVLDVIFTYDEDADVESVDFSTVVTEDNNDHITEPEPTEITVTLACPSDIYTDAAKIQNEWYHDYVDFVTHNGVMKGRDDGSFDAYATLTRAELWTMLSRLDPTFTPETLETDATWADTYQRWALSAGVSDGTDPFRGVTRQEAVTMIYRFAKYIGVDVSAAADLTSFKDADAVADWAGDAMSWAVAKGIIEGDDTGALNPNSTALRSHIAKIVAVYMQVA